MLFILIKCTHRNGHRELQRIEINCVQCGEKTRVNVKHPCQTPETFLVEVSGFGQEELMVTEILHEQQSSM